MKFLPNSFIIIFIMVISRGSNHILDKEYNDLSSSNESVFMTKTLKINGNLKTNELYTDNLISDKTITVSDYINSINIEANTVVTDILVSDEIFSDKELVLNGNIILINNVLSDSLKINQLSETENNINKNTSSEQVKSNQIKTNQSNRDSNWILANQHSSFIETNSIIKNSNNEFEFTLNMEHKEIKIMSIVKFHENDKARNNYKEFNEENDEFYMFVDNILVWQSKNQYISNDSKVYNISASFNHSGNTVNISFCNKQGYFKKIERILEDSLSKENNLDKKINISDNIDTSNDVTINELFIYYS